MRAARGEPVATPLMGGGALEEGAKTPPGANGADFKTLQQMIAKGIKEAEALASKIEDPRLCRAAEDEAEMKRHLEGQRRRRDDEVAARQKERDAVRQKRRREDEERRRRQAEESERQEDNDRLAREERERVEVRQRLETAAATRIQSRIRGRQSRAGKHTLTLLPVSAVRPPPRGSARPSRARNSARGVAAEEIEDSLLLS